MGDRARTAFVGRSTDLAVLDAAWRRTLAHGGGTVLLVGDAGIGKSRLVAELAARAVGDGAVVVAGGCGDLGERGFPYGPFAEALRAAARDGVLDPASLNLSVRRELGLLVSRLAPEPDAADAAGSTAVRPDGGDELGRSRLFEAVLEAYETMAARCPVVAVIEDIHWADRSTIDLLSFLARNLAGSPVLLLVTLRPDLLEAGDLTTGVIVELGRRTGVVRVDVGPLDPAGSIALVEALSPQPVDAAAAAAIHERSDGNPYFIEELVAAGLAAAGADRTLMPLPPTLRDVLLARLAHLSPQTQRLIGVAAVAGRAVDERVLEAAAELTGTALARALREAVSHGVLARARPLDGRTSTERSQHVFRHALMQEAVYADLMAGERREAHRAVARALDSVRPTSDADRAELAARRAHHLDRAGDVAAAIPAALEAAAAAEAVAAFGDAHAWYARALELLDEGGAPSPGVDTTSVALAAAETAEMSGDARRAVDYARRALAEVDPLDVDRRTGIVERLSEHLWSSGDNALVDVMTEVLDSLRAERPSLARALASFVVGNGAYFAGDQAASLRHWNQAVSDANAVGAAGEQAYALSMRAFLSSAIGDVGRTVEDAEAAIALMRPDLPVFRRLAIEGNVVGALSFVGRHHRAIELASAAARRARIGGYDRASGGILVANAVDSLLLLGHPRDALALVDGVRVGDGSPYVEVAWLSARARALTWLGRTDEARAHVARMPEPEAVENPVTARGVLYPRIEIGVLDDHPLEARANGRHLFRFREASSIGLEFDALVAPLLMTAEAELAAQARARRDAADLRTALTEAERVAAIAMSPVVRRLAAGVPHFAVGVRLTELEHERVLERPAVDGWRALAADAEANGLVPFATQARVRAAEGLLAGNHRREAGDELRHAHAMAHEHELAWLVRLAEGVATRARVDLSPSPAAVVPVPREADPYGLTQREREILALVAAGLTNRQIGDRLFISPKTAGVHISNILGKLGVAGRVEAAVIAHRMGLPTVEASPTTGSRSGS